MSVFSKRLFEGLADGPLPEWPRLQTQIAVRRVERGGSVFMQGVDHPFVYVVGSGLIKNVYLRDSGEDWIKSFSHEGLFFASIAALRPGGLTSFAAIAIEDCVLERIPFSLLEELAGIHLSWARVMRAALMMFAERKEKRERELLTLNAEERYCEFLAEAPALQSRVPQKDLARYLGLTPVGLNRIVKRVRAV